jgi:hypothetical protein
VNLELSVADRKKSPSGFPDFLMRILSTGRGSIREIRGNP